MKNALSREKFKQKCRQTEIGDYIELIYGDGLPERDREGGKYPVYGSNGIVGYHDRALVKGPGIIIGRKGTVGQVTLSKDDFWPIDTTYYVNLKEGGDIFFWFYLLQTLGLSQMNSHSAVPGLNRDNVYSILKEIPSPAEQRAIVKILSDLDEKIELNHQMNKTLESIAQAFFKQLFIEKKGNSKRISISDIIEFDPRMLAKKRDILPYVDMKELSTEGMTVGAVILKSFSGGSKFQNSDTLLARITPCLENGKTAFVGFLTDKQPIGFGSTEFIVMRAKQGISPQFVYCLARDPEFRSFAIKSMIGSSGRQRVQRNMLESYEIFKPDQDSMNNFHKATFPLFSKVIENWKETKALIQIRDSLLPRLMSGKIRVRLNNL